MSRNQNLLFIIFSILYFGLMLVTPFNGDWLFKIAPLIVIGWAIMEVHDKKLKIILSLALLFSMGGDTLLSMGLFVPGLVSFLIAQLIYFSLFFGRFSGWTTRGAGSLILVVFMAVMAWSLWPVLGDLQIPVMAYLCVIGAMGLAAVMSNVPAMPAVVGAFLFIVSDALIAVNKFLYSFEASGWLIMLTYYAAQWCLYNGFIRDLTTDSEARY